MGSNVPMGDSTKSGSKYKRPMDAATNKVIHRVLSPMSASEISMPDKDQTVNFFPCYKLTTAPFQKFTPLVSACDCNTFSSTDLGNQEAQEMPTTRHRVEKVEYLHRKVWVTAVIIQDLSTQWSVSKWKIQYQLRI